MGRHTGGAVAPLNARYGWWLPPAGLAHAGVCLGWLDLPGPRTAQRQALRQQLPSLMAAVLGLEHAAFALEEGEPAPWLVEQHSARRLALSFSYAGARAAFAVATRPLGVDLVALEELPDWPAVAQDFLGPETARRIAGLPNAARTAAFCLAWAELEARGKALGLGLELWTPARAARLATCELIYHAVQEGFTIAVATAGNGDVT